MSKSRKKKKEEQEEEEEQPKPKPPISKKFSPPTIIVNIVLTFVILFGYHMYVHSRSQMILRTEEILETFMQEEIPNLIKEEVSKMGSKKFLLDLITKFADQ